MLLASCHARIAHWLRPDAVIVCRAGLPAVVLRIADAAGGQLPLCISVRDDGSRPLSTASTAAGAAGDRDGGDGDARSDGGNDDGGGGGGGGGGGELFLHALRRCGLPILTERCYDDAPAFRHDASAEPPTGGRVLAARVERTEATRSVETFFDLPNDGSCARRLPVFPSLHDVTDCNRHDVTVTM